MSVSTQNVYFIDADLADLDAVLAGIPAGAEVYQLDRQHDGLEQMLAALAGRTGLAGIHLLTHGAPGELQLGATRVDQQTLQQRAADFTALGATLADGGDLLIYGCNVAEGEAGLAFLQALAEATGADVAASDDLTGAGGDWVLEAATGPLEASALEVSGMSGTLSATNTAPSFSFPGDGKVSTDLGSYDVAHSVAVQPDGKIVVAGFSGPDFALVRYHADGSLDTGFGNAGKVITDIRSSADEARSVAVQPDGKIVVAGFSAGDFALVRYNADGSLDTGFGGSGSGKVTTDLGSGADEAWSMTLQPDGKIVVAGSSGSDFALVRYQADGSLDTDLGGTGKVSTQLGFWQDQGRSVVLQLDGKLVVAGFSDNGSNNDFALVRYHADGSLDENFGNGGQVLTAIGSSGDQAWSVALQSDGKIVAAGHSYVSGSSDDFALVRYNTDGSLDTSFGDMGKVTTAISASMDWGRSVTVQPDGKILVAGIAGDTSSFALVRYNADGSLDTGFGGTGKVITAVGALYDEAWSVTVQPDGKIVVAGRDAYDTIGAFALVRYNADGSLDTSFDSVSTLGGTANFTEGGTAVVLDADASLRDAELDALDGGLGNYGGASLTLARSGGASAEDVFSASGTLGALAEGATLTVDGIAIGSVVQNSAGTLVLGFNGSATTARVNQALRQIAYSNTSDAAPASVQIGWSFSDGNSGGQGSGGALTASGTSAVHIAGTNDAPVLDAATPLGLPAVEEGATDPAGVTVASLLEGRISDPDGSAVHALALTALDTSLGTWQYRLDGGSAWLTIRADLVNSDTNELALLLGPTAQLRLLPFGDLNGRLEQAITFRAWDRSSGNEGSYVLIDAGGGSTPYSSDSATASLAVAPVNDAPTFAPPGGTGKLIVPHSNTNEFARSVVLQPDGKIVVAGESRNSSDIDFCLIRLNADGSLDTSFNGSGKAIVPVGGGKDYGQSIAMQSDGKLLVAGRSYNDSGTDTDFSLIRLHADGSLDTSFNGNGKLIMPVGSGGDFGYGLAVQPDGRILVAGSSWVGTNNSDFSLIRLNTDGSLDTSFNGSGKALVPVGNSGDSVYSLTLQSDGRILVSGQSWNGSNGDFSLIRLNTDGSLDTSFNGSGKLIVPVGSGDDYGYSVTVQPDGRILVAGQSSLDDGGNGRFSLIRLNADGSLDTSFNGSGKLIVPAGEIGDSAKSVTVQPDGKILVAGGSVRSSSEGYSYLDFGLIRLNTDGSLDTSFNGNGKAIVPIGSDYAEGTSVTVQPDGRIVVAGTGYLQGSGYHSMVIRLNADGSLDTSFGGSPIETLGGTAAYTEGTAPVVLDASVQIHDIDLGALDEGAGNYAGASVALARVGGASAEDVFSGTGDLVLANGLAELAGVSIGSYTQSGGTLKISFNSNATQARVNAALSALGYANLSDAPPASVLIGWTFSDGNGGAQGSGGALSASGTTTVHLTGVNDAPTGGLTIQGRALTGTTLSVSSTVADPDGPATPDLQYQWQADGQDIAGATASTLLLDASLLGKRIGVVARYTDGGGTLESVASSATIPVGLWLAGTASADSLQGSAQADSLAGAAGNDTLVGREGHDTLLGHEGDDWLDGGTGADAMQGGAGNDTYVVDQTGDIVIESADSLNGGLDTVRASVSHTLAAHVENLVLTGSAVIGGNGNGLANRLSGNTAANVLDGRGGADTMIGGWGDDTYIVNDTGDIVIESADSLNGGLDTVRTSVSHTLAAYIENLVLTGSAAIDGSGNGLDNHITGNSAANVLRGGGGADTLVGGLGNDTYVVDNEGDVVIESADAPDGGIDTVNASISYLLGSHVENLVLTGSAAIDATGNSLSNRLAGNAAANLLNGRGGADTMSGGAGDDTYVVDDAGDVVIESADALNGGLDMVRASVSHTLGAYVEDLMLTGSSAVDATGNGLANMLTGNAAANLLDGRGGADTMIGGLGDDTYVVDNAGDVVIESADSVSGGSDTVRASISCTLGTHVEHLLFTGSGAIDGSGNGLANRLTGNVGANVLDGRGGADTMIGGLGNDTYVVDSAGDVVIESADSVSGGSDTVRSSVSYTLGAHVEHLVLGGSAAIDGSGNGLANTLSGNSATNLLDGRGGADTLAGQSGHDTLSGGLGDDVFVFDTALNAASNVDTILDFSKVAGNRDRIHLDDDVFRALGSVTQPTALAAAAFCVGTAATTASQRVVYDPASGALYYDADGSGAGAQVQFAQLGTVSHPVLGAADFLIVA